MEPADKLTPNEFVAIQCEYMRGPTGDWQAFLQRRAREVLGDQGERRAPPEVAERFDVLPFGGLLRAARAMGHGMEQGYETEDGEYCHWRRQPASYHLNRAILM